MSVRIVLRTFILQSKLNLVHKSRLLVSAPICAAEFREAAGDTGRPVRLLEPMMQSRDHPADLSAENAWYLKGYILQVL